MTGKFTLCTCKKGKPKTEMVCTSYRMNDEEVPVPFVFPVEQPDEAIGDVNSDARGSGARYNQGKPPMELFPLDTIFGACQVLDYGRRKYAEWNWAKGSAHSVPYACMLRHLAAWHSGEEIDPESGLHHLDHAMCNMMFLKYYQLHYPEMDDRFKRPEHPY